MANQKLKLLYILDLLTTKSDENHPVDIEQILLYLQNHGITCERKSVYSDISVLKEFGYDILFTKGSESGYFLASRDFESAEIRLLCDAVQAANFISPKKTQLLMDKILHLLSIGQAQEIKQQVHVENRPKTNNEEIYYHIDKLNRAIQSGWQVELTYRRRIIGDQNAVEYEEKRHKISPYAMIWSDDHYYLVGNNEKYDNLMVLRLDRIRRLEIMDGERVRPFSEVSPYKNFFDSADYAKKHFNMFAGNTEHVELICKNDLIEQVLDKFGENIRVYRVNEDKFGVSADIAVNEGLVAWLMQFGARVQVKKPQSLKNMLLSRIDEIKGVYII